MIYVIEVVSLRCPRSSSSEPRPTRVDLASQSGLIVQIRRTLALLIVILHTILASLSQFNYDIIWVATQICPATIDSHGAEGESAAEICVDDDVLEVDERLGGLACQPLLLGDEDHSKCLPDTPHDNQALLARLFQTLDSASL